MCVFDFSLCSDYPGRVAEVCVMIISKFLYHCFGGFDCFCRGFIFVILLFGFFLSWVERRFFQVFCMFLRLVLVFCWFCEDHCITILSPVHGR